MDTMTPRERWLAVLNGEEPDRVPMDYWGTPEATARMMAHLGVSDVEAMDAALHIDRPVDVAPAYVGPPVDEDADMYGCRFERVDYGTGAYRECVVHPLARYDTVAEIEADYRWPEPDWFDPSPIPAQIAAHPDRPIQLDMAGNYTQYTWLRGMEQAFVDFALNHEIVRYCMERLYDLHHEIARRAFDVADGGIHLGKIANDLGSQLDILCSPETVRKLFIPGIRKLARLAHDHGVFVFLHSDGAIRKAIPDLIDAGVDVLNPIQWRCEGMDRAALKRDFGQDLIFHGAMDNQHTLVYGSADDVRAEVQENLRILGAGGGYILAPCHRIQAVSPPALIVAMYEAGYELGRREESRTEN
jgi:uroporphyrinogen decarboxylase